MDKIAGGGGGGAAWVLRIGTAIYLAATILGLRLPERVDSADFDETAAYGPPGQAAGRGTDEAPGANGTRPNIGGSTARRRRIFTVPTVGPIVGEAMRANAAIRVFYGFMLFFLVFILRIEHFGSTSYKVALGGLAVAITAGSILGTTIGSALRSRAPQAMMFTVIGLATLVSTVCAILFGLWSVLVVALVAAISQTLVKVALDSILQREIPAETRSSTFAFSETLHQLALVGGGLHRLAAVADRQRLRRTDRCRGGPGARPVLAGAGSPPQDRARQADDSRPGALSAGQRLPLQRTAGSVRGQVSRSVATARRTAAIFFASRLSGCFERR